MKTAAQIYQETQDDLAGRNGSEARGRTLHGLMRMQARQMVDCMMVFGTHDTRAINAGGAILLTNR